MPTLTFVCFILFQFLKGSLYFKETIYTLIGKDVCNYLEMTRATNFKITNT